MQLSDWAHWPSCQANLGSASWFSCLIAVWPWVGYLGSLRLEWGEITFRGRTEILHVKHSWYNAWDHLVSDQEKWDWRLLSPSARRQVGSTALLHLWLSLTKNLSTTSPYIPWSEFCKVHIKPILISRSCDLRGSPLATMYMIFG